MSLDLSCPISTISFYQSGKILTPMRDSGICLYAQGDLQERNETYKIEEVEPDYFMIGQEGDLAYFIKKNSDDCIYENDLGALGSLEMQKVAKNVNDFIDKVLGEELQKTEGSNHVQDA